MGVGSYAVCVAAGYCSLPRLPDINLPDVDPTELILPPFRPGRGYPRWDTPMPIPWGRPRDWGGAPPSILPDWICFAKGGKDKKREKPGWRENKSKRKGSENRQPSGEREPNVRHPDGEEHSRVPKGAGRGSRPIGGHW